MDLQPYLNRIAGDLDRVTALADEQTRDVSRRLVVALEPGLRLAMTELLADASAELSSRLGGNVITVRVDGQEPILQVSETTPPEPVGPPAPPAPPTAPDEAEDGTARVTVRLPEGLKRRAEDLAQQARRSLNTWIVDAVRVATEPETYSYSSSNSRSSSSSNSARRLTGWA